MSSSVGSRTSRSLIYGLNLLALFTAEQPVRSIAELAELMGLSSTCLELGYLEQAPMRRYRLARRSAMPGVALLGSLAIARAAAPILRDLRDHTGRTVSQAVLAATDVLYLQRLCGSERGQYALERSLGTGSRRPATRTAAGQALLTSLQADESPATGELDSGGLTHDRGRLTHDSGGLGENARGLATWVHAEGHRRCAIEITAPADAIGASELVDELGEPLLAAGAALRTALAGSRCEPSLTGLAH
jgi:DNA-binding IclR family transcriptional regulator